MLKLTHAAVTLLMLAATSVTGAQATVRVSVSPGSKLWIEGTSNVHDWKCEATSLDASIDIDATAAQLATASPALLRKVSVKIPVKALKCGHDKMDDNMYKALKADANDEISYIMATFEAVKGDQDDQFGLKTAGTLKLAGVENKVTVDVDATRLPDGTIKAIGSVPVKMTAFGVKPPTAMFGAIRAGDEVKVKFEMTVGPKVIAAALGAGSR
jgi:polyisoprenoid-binding protein YceI